MIDIRWAACRVMKGVVAVLGICWAVAESKRRCGTQYAYGTTRFLSLVSKILSLEQCISLRSVQMRRSFEVDLHTRNRVLFLAVLSLNRLGIFGSFLKVDSFGQMSPPSRVWQISQAWANPRLPLPHSEYDICRRFQRWYRCTGRSLDWQAKPGVEWHTCGILTDGIGQKKLYQ